MTSKSVLKKAPGITIGKENNGLAVQKSQADRERDLADAGAAVTGKSRRPSAREQADDKKRANHKKTSNQQVAPIVQNYFDGDRPSNSEPTIDALRQQKVFDYRHRATERDVLDLNMNYAKDQNPQNFHSAQNRNSARDHPSGKGTHTALDLRVLNEDLRGFKTPQELQTLNASNRVGPRQKSRTRPETQMQRPPKNYAERLGLPEVTQEQAIRQEYNQQSSGLVGRIVGAPSLVVTSHLSREEEQYHERKKELMVLDMIASNIANQHASSQSKYKRQSQSPNSRQNLSFPDRKRDLKSNMSGARQSKNRQDHSKGKASKSQDQIRPGGAPSQSKIQLNKVLHSKQKREKSLLEYLDSSLAGQEPPMQTLNILTATAGQFNHKGRDPSKSVVAQSNPVRDDPKKRSGDKDRSLIQTKYLNFQRDASHKNSNSHERRRKDPKASKKGLARDSSNSRSRSREVLSKEASRERYQALKLNQSSQQPIPPLVTISQNDSDMRKKQQKASNNLLAMINLAKKQKHSVDTANNTNLKHPSPTRPTKAQQPSRSFNAHLGTHLGRYARANQSLSPKNMVEKYTESVPKQNQRSQNLLSKNIAIGSSQKLVARSAPGFCNIQSIEKDSSIELANETDETVSLFKNAKHQAMEKAERDKERAERRERKNRSASQLEDQISIPAGKKKSRSPNRDRSKPGASKIDKLIRENLKKQIRKDLEQKEKERQAKLEQKRRKLELEQANERARRQTESQVQRSKEKMQKIQMMKQIQQNLTNSGLTSSINEKTLEANLQGLLGSRGKDDLTAEMTRLLQQIDERPPPQKRSKPKPKPEAQTQLQTQKLEQTKLESIEQLESMLENDYLPRDSEMFNKPKLTLSNAESQLLPTGTKSRRKDESDKSFAVDKQRDHRRSNGLDFFDMRKEILSEIKHLKIKKKKGKKADKQLKATIINKDEDLPTDGAIKDSQQFVQLRRSLSQRQLLEQAAQAQSLKQPKKPAERKIELLYNVIARDKSKAGEMEINASLLEGKPKKQFSLDISKLLERASIQQEQNQTAPMKKELIRKFMKDKQKQHNYEAEKQKQQEVKKALKVHANLVKLNKFCKKQMLNSTGRAAAIQLTNKISVPSVNITKNTVRIKHKIAPDARKSDLEVAEPNELTITPNRMLFEDSEPSLNVSGTRISRGVSAAQSRKDASLRNKPIEGTDDLYEDSKMQSMQTLEERPINSLRLQRPITKRINKFQANLAPCFEKSNSAKTLRAQLGKKSQSPPKPLDAQKKVNQSVNVGGNTVKISAPVSRDNKKFRNLRTRSKKGGKSITKGSGGPTVYMQPVQSAKLGLNQHFNVKVPKMMTKRRCSSVDTLESPRADSLRGSGEKRFRVSQHRVNSSVKKHQKRSQAAIMIQREVRKYLKRLGFYEAREIMSPEREPQISLFIEKRVEPLNEAKGSRKTSKSRSGSRSSGKKGSKKTKKQVEAESRNSPGPKKSSGNKGSILRHPLPRMQKTTVIAEISGLKQNQLFDQARKSFQSQGNEENPTDLEGQARVASAQLNESNFASGKSGARLSGLIQPSPDTEEMPIESGRIINLNKVQVLPNFSQLNFFEGPLDDESAKISPDPKKGGKKSTTKPGKQIRPKDKEGKKPKTFNYNPKQIDVPVSESVSILDRLQGTSAANNFSKEEQRKAGLLDSQLPALNEDKLDVRNKAFWLQAPEQMKSVQTPKSGSNIVYPEGQPGHQNLAQKSASISETEQRRNQSASLDRSSKELIADGVSQSSGSVFDRNAFQQFASNQKNQVMQKSDYQKLIKFREDALRIREHKEKRHIQKLLKNKECSPRTYHAKKEQIDRWVHIEKMEIEKTKLTFQQEWDKTVRMIEETQKSVENIRSKINIQHSNTNSNNLAASSLTSGQKPHGSSISTSAKKPSILIEDPPKSYRSNHLDHQPPIERTQELSSHRSATYGHHQENLLQYLEKRMASHEALNQNRQERTESGELVPHSQMDGEFDQLRSGDQSEISQQPSAEFLERLENAKRLEHQMHLNLGNFDEPELDDKLDQLSQDMDDNVDLVGGFVPGLDVQENDFHDKLLSSDLKDPAETDRVPDDLTHSPMNGNIVQSNLIDEPFQPEMPTFYQDPYLKSEPDLLNEPAIISGGEPALITAKVKSPKPLVQGRRVVSSEIDALIKDEEAKEDLADLLTEAIIESLLKECVQLPQPRAQPVEEKRQEEEKDQNVDVFLVDSQIRDKEEKKEWIEIRQRHLIENDLIRIDQYTNEIVDSLLQFEIDLSSEEDSLQTKNLIENYHIQFLKQLTQPIQKEPLTILQALQTSEIGSYKHFETTQDLQKHPIIPVDLYLDIEKAREEAMIQRKGPNITRETQLVWESIHIQNKSFFDAVNESLMKFRPYGLTGEPMPWSNKIRRLQTKVDIGSVDTERLFQMVKQEVFRWAQTYCGCLPSPIFAFPSNRTRQEEFNNELFQEFREKRQTQVLWTETVEQEHHWLNFDYEEAQVKIDLSDMILEHLVDELVDLLAHEGVPSAKVEEIIINPKSQVPPPSSPFGETPERTQEVNK